MRIILNSDVLFGDYLRHGLPQNIKDLAKACNENGHTVCLLRTSLWEVERRQNELVNNTRREVLAAYQLLDRLGVSHDQTPPSDLVVVPDVVAMLSEHCALTEVLEPSAADYESAHRRACFHLPPQAPNAKSDEMRDLIIWATSLRVASADGQALLISRDVVHSHDRGDYEADQAKLSRVSSVEDALDFLHLASPARQLLEELLAPAWDALIVAGVPISLPIAVVSVSGARFVQGANGLVGASAALVARDRDDKVLEGDIHLTIGYGAQSEVRLRGGRLSDVPVGDLDADYTFVALADNESGDTSTADALEALRALFEGS